MLGGRERAEGWANRARPGLLAAAVVLAASGTVTAVVREAHRPPPEAFLRPVPHVGRAAATAGALPLQPGADPLRVRIPAIGVDAPLVPLGLNDDGTLQVPPYEQAGWYAGGSRPGEPGPSVIAAHVDSTTGPAVFHRLDDLEPGQVIQVDYGDASVGFVVRNARRVGKAEFPTEEVYGPTHAPELRLVTCAGSFDRRTGNYADNLIVWADVLDTTPA